MGAWTNGTYTKKGLSLLSKLTQGNSLHITRVVAGTGYVAQTALANQTAVSGIKQELSLKAASYPDVGVCKLPMFLTNKGVASGYKARQIGVYATDPDDGEILYFISQSESGTEVPSEASMPEYSATWTFTFRYGQADNVSITVDPSHTVTEDMLNDVRVIAETGVSAPNNGTALVVKNTAELPFANLRLFGKTLQKGTPTPDNPVDLTPAGVYAAGSYHHTINISGKNLLNVSLQSGTHSGLTVTVHDDGKIEAKGTSTGGGIYLQRDLILAPGKYTFSVGNTMSLEEGNGIWVYGDGASLFLKKDASGTFNVSKTTSFNVYLFPTVGANWDVSIYPQIEFGPVATGYEKGKGTQTLAIETPDGLNGIPVKSGGNYTDADGQQWVCDEIDFARGVYVKRVKQVTYDGDEVWVKSGENNYYTRVMDAKRVLPMCDKLGPRTTDTAPYIRDAITGDGVVAISVSLGADVVSSADEFKSAISQNPLQVLYALATPIETPLTDGEISAFESLISHNPITTAVNDAGADMEVDCFLKQHESAIFRILQRIESRFQHLDERYSELNERIDNLENS